ncbi:MAG: hypothetical protein IKL18_02640, partial [Oscillospiraceae bacterium]|nr:hypothetical protein [Oscillospiraceae bacterium]
MTEGSHCDVCGETLVAQIEVDALGHNYEAAVTAPTCENAGYTTYTCSNCNDSYVADEVAALTHAYSSEVTKEATCTEAGVKTFTCANCGDTYTEEIAAIGHDYKAEVIAPTCEDAGYTTYTCSNCGDVYTADEVDALGHSYDEGTVTKEATCTEKGSKLFTCSTCGDTYTEEIKAKGHSLTFKITPATCTVDGYVTNICTVCDYSYISGTITASGHKYTSEVTEPTCEDAGYTTYTCSSCGDTYTADDVPALGHTPVVDAAVAPD